MEELRKKTEEHCGKGVPREAQLLELGWMTEDIVVLYLACKCGEKRSHVEDNWGQGVIPFWKWKELSWCGCKGKKRESSVPTERKSVARVEKAARPREAKAQQSGAWSGELECHDLAKRLSYYLYFFSFLFLFFYLGLTTQREVWESVMSQVSHSHTVT